MANPSNFDPATNPLATQKLEPAYLIATSRFGLSQLYANLILAQPDLNVSQADPGLATAIGAYQARMKTNASFVLKKLTPEFVTSVTDGSSFGGLINHAFSSDTINILNVHEDAGDARAVASELANEAGEIGVHLNSLKASYAAGQNATDSYVENYNNNLAKAIDLLGQSAKQIASEIDGVQDAITKNINDIVEGSKEVGGAFRDLGTGMLDMISGAANEPKKDDKNKDKDKEKEKEAEEEDNDDEEEEEENKDKEKEDEEDDEEEEDDDDEEEDQKPAPNVDFAVHAIESGASGQEKASQAAHDLRANNLKMAAAYQKMAQQNVLVAIAKVMEVQNKLFLAAFAQIGPSVGELKTEWRAVESAYRDFGQQLSSVQTPAEANDLGDRVQGAKSLWKALGGQLDYVKASLSGTN